MVDNPSMPRAIRTLRRLARQWKVPVVTQYKEDAFTTLISCILSLRTNDAVTHQASERLFGLAQTPQAMRWLSIRTIEKAIYPVSFYRTKAKTLLTVCETLCARFGGRVPDSLDELLTLNGVGRKTANLVVTLAYQKEGICVDTHVHRISNRWGYVRTPTPEKTEWALREKLPKRFWLIYNELLVAFGQNLCRPTSPWCSRCPLADICPRIGVTTQR